LRAVTPAGAMAVAAFCGVVRWGVLAQTVDVRALGLVQPLHGFTFALLHLAAMRIIGDTVPRDLAATAQAVYGLVAVGGATAVLILLSGWLYAHFGAAGFWGMAALCVAAFPRHLAAAADASLERAAGKFDLALLIHSGLSLRLAPFRVSVVSMLANLVIEANRFEVTSQPLGSSTVAEPKAQ
jgi:MFS family permease